MDQLMVALAGKLDNPIVLLFVLVIVGYATFAERMAKIAGPLGALARAFNRRQEGRVEREHALWRARYSSDTEKADARVADLTKQVAYLEGELRDARTELAAARKEVSAMHQELRETRVQLSDAFVQLNEIRRVTTATNNKMDNLES